MLKTNTYTGTLPYENATVGAFGVLWIVTSTLTTPYVLLSTYFRVLRYRDTKARIFLRGDEDDYRMVCQTAWMRQCPADLSCRRIVVNDFLASDAHNRATAIVYTAS